jgi:hypothetical protein
MGSAAASPGTNSDPVESIYAIVRLKAARKAWYWAVHFRRRGRLYYKRFYDLKHGGPEPAFAAAKAWRDRALAKAKILTHREFHAQRRSNNTSGVAGVHLVKSARQPSGAWQAKIKLSDGRKITKSFSILKFGRKEAFRRATAARADMLALIDEQPYLYDDTAKRFAARQRGRGKDTKADTSG